MLTKLRPESYEEFIATFHIEAPEHFNFAFDVIDARAMANPQEPAMIHLDDKGVRREFDYGFFATQSSRLAHSLQKKGIGKGDTVMLILYRRMEFWVAMLALHKLGAIAIPSPSLLTAHDITERVAVADVRCLIVEEGIVPTVEAARKNCPDLRLLVQVGGDTVSPGWEAYESFIAHAPDSFPRPKDAAGGDDPLLIFFSSGTTGLPKMVEHTHTYALGHILTGLYWHDLEPGDIHLTVADTGWGKAAWGKLYGQWMAGAIVFVYDFRGKFSPKNLLQAVADNKVTSFCAPPTVYRFLIREDLTKFDLSALRHCTTAGELLNYSVFQAWEELVGLPIYEGYGQTETALQIATFPCMKPKPGSIGKPVPGWDIVLLDAEGTPCPAGVEGEICINIKNGKPYGLMASYLKEPEKTADAYRHGYFHTGDKAWMDEDGYYWFMGRVDDLIKSSGYRVGPFEVESALVAHDAVVEAAVTGVPDPLRGQAVKATIVLGPGYEASDELTKELQNHVKKLTAPYKYPRVIEYVTDLPKTISGKIKRAEIRARDMAKMK
ncbi:MAG: AMP-binding protein [Desulfoplanes sp.]